MLVYRARLAERATAVISVAVLPCRAPARALGAGALAARCRICLRYAGAGGRVRRHRGFLQASLAPGTRLTVAGCQLDDDGVLLSLQPAPAQKAPARGAALADRFRLPVSLVAWGVTALTGARVWLRLSCRATGGSLVIRGILHVRLEAAAAALHLRVPFIRLLAADAAPPGLRWRVAGGVTGLHLCVKPGGQISGEVVLGLRCDGRPPAPGAGAAATPAAAPPLARVRELTARIAKLAAGHAGPGHALVRGSVEVDIYGFDQAGRSRWTGRSLPFSALLPLNGLAEQDRLEPEAHILRAAREGEAIQVVLAAGVTGLRPAPVMLGAVPYRLEQVVGQAESTLTLSEPLPTGGPLPTTMASPRAEVRPAFLPLPGPAEGWSELAVALSMPEARGGRGSGRWSVRAALGGTPLDGAPYPAPLHAVTGGTVDLGTGEVLTAVPALVAIGPAGVHLRTLLVPDQPGVRLERPIPAGAATVEGVLPLPHGECRLISGLLIDSDLRAGALVRTEGAGAVLTEGQIAPGEGRPVGALAYPVRHGDGWQLALTVALAETGPAGD